MTYQTKNTSGQTRNSVITSLINRFTLKAQWKEIKGWGTQTAKQFKVTSEDDIDRIINEHVLQDVLYR